MEICPEILEFPALPPDDEVRQKKNYHYAPCPRDVANPVLRIPYLHVLLEPGIHLDEFWVNRSPKKLRQRIEYGSGTHPAIGWGVHIVEGPNWVAISVVSQIVLFLTLILSVLFSVLKNDVSAGFAMGAYVVAALTAVNALAVVILTQRS